MESQEIIKPLGRKAYGSIPHLPGSRRGPGDHGINDGQARILLEKTRDSKDRVIVTEKVDGSNMAVVLHKGEVLALTRSGRLAQAGQLAQHQMFADWVRDYEDLFRGILREGEQISGEWLAQAHGTKYDLESAECELPFIVFDMFDSNRNRLPWDEVIARTDDKLERVGHFHDGGACSISKAMEALSHCSGNLYGGYASIGPPEGAVWRLERNGKFDFMAKYVRPDKLDGCYLPGINPEVTEDIWNFNYWEKKRVRNE